VPSARGLCDKAQISAASGALAAFPAKAYSLGAIIGLKAEKLPILQSIYVAHVCASQHLPRISSTGTDFK
jgi:hypothetical protein